MYRISKQQSCLLVEFEDDFDLSVIKQIINEVTRLGEYPDTDDIWLIGGHRAEIHLADLEIMVREFQCRCPKDATRTKTAIVVDAGLTGSIIELWVHALKKRVSFDLRIFRSVEEAEAWIDAGAEKVA